MSVCRAPSVAPQSDAEQARIRVGMALSLLELAAQVLDSLRPPEVAFPFRDRELYRYLQALQDWSERR